MSVSPTKAESLRRYWGIHQLEKTAGQHSQVATSGSSMSRRMLTLYRCLRCGDLRSPGVTERRNGPLGLGPMRRHR